MKKVLAIIMAVIMTIGFAGCEKVGEESNGKSVSKEKFSTEGTIETMVVYDEDGIKVTATDLSYDNFAATLHLLVQNESEDELSFYESGNSFVNGYYYSSIDFWEWLDVGEETEIDIDLYFDKLQMYGITEIADIELGVATGWREYITISIPTSLYDSYDFTKDTFKNVIKNENDIIYYSDETFYDDYGVCIPCISVLKDDYNGTTLLVEIINDSENDVGSSLLNFRFNDILVCDDYDYKTLSANRKYVFEILFSDIIYEYDGDTSALSPLKNFSFTFGVGRDTNHISDTKTISITLPTDED